jgi:UDP-glucose 4-epimerase
MSAYGPAGKDTTKDSGSELVIASARGFTLFGRVYIHTNDFCEAHLLVLKSLIQGAGSQSYNLGNGNGFSVQEVIDAAIRVTGRPITVHDAPRRVGDPARLVADATLARQQLGWQPQFADLETMVRHAWVWENRSRVNQTE